MRKFSPRELNWLRRWEVSQTSQVKRYGEMPVEYITGFAEFYGREFRVNKDVLIPRIETEQLVDEAKNIIISYSLLPTPYSISIADIGTGCGCIGITLYLELIKLGIRPTIYMSDISERALEVARKNILLTKVRPSDGRSDLIILKSDLFYGYPKDLRFDLIVANLPYVPSARIPKLPESVRKFEPRAAIVGGKDGALLIKKLMKQSRKRLVRGGAMVLEIDETHSEDTFAIETKGEFKSETKPDQFGKNRFLVLYKKQFMISERGFAE